MNGSSNKQLSATLSTRPYKSRSQRPCDYCRKKKMCCIIADGICMACLKHGLQCTFEDGPQKKKKKNQMESKSVGRRQRRVTKSIHRKKQPRTIPDMQFSAPTVQLTPEVTMENLFIESLGYGFRTDVPIRKEEKDTLDYFAVDFNYDLIEYTFPNFNELDMMNVVGSDYSDIFDYSNIPNLEII